MRAAPPDPPPDVGPKATGGPARPSFAWGLGVACLIATAGFLGLLALALYGHHTKLLRRIAPSSFIAPGLIDVCLVLVFAARHSRHWAAGGVLQRLLGVWRRDTDPRRENDSRDGS